MAELIWKFIMENKWYQIYTKSNAEKKLYIKILAYGFEAFLPIRKLKKRQGNRIKIIEEPAFKSYIFAKLDYEGMRRVERLSQFCFYVSYCGVVNLSGQNNKKNFPCITDKTVKQIEHVLAEHPQAIMIDKALVKGDKVEITEGSLKNYKGILMNQPSGNKVAIKLHGLNQSMIISVPIQLLQKSA